MGVAKKIFESEVVRLADLALVNDVLDGYEFRDCLLLGPAIVVPMGETSISNSMFNGEIDALFWLVETGRELIVGAIGLHNCVIDGCSFQRVGFAGPIELRQVMEENVQPGNGGAQ